MGRHGYSVRFDDGASAHRDFRAFHGAAAGDRKAKQLCAQVAEALDLTLAGESVDPILQDLTLLAVEPAPDQSRLLVTLALADPEVAPAEVTLHLEHAKGWLRSVVAAEICRRKAPELCFRVLGGGRLG